MFLLYTEVPCCPLSEVPCCPLTAHSTWNRLRFCSDIWLVFLFPFPHDLHMTWLFVNLYFL